MDVCRTVTTPCNQRVRVPVAYSPSITLQPPSISSSPLHRLTLYTIRYFIPTRCVSNTQCVTVLVGHFHHPIPLFIIQFPPLSSNSHFHHAIPPPSLYSPTIRHFIPIQGASKALVTPLR
ncbi:hypothetical protein EVAR_90426_1 [Eumeta japonica]|uniref:Uncharacterized protein n=1 Tax=Eumeta variegata TaxID=151549 RepID=A0A4C1YBD2_EUMVA|nr:hypothetical protein EVAR_90426_1 [Eumeta japonica]